jgi:hypothetical protein
MYSIRFLLFYYLFINNYLLAELFYKLMIKILQAQTPFCAHWSLLFVPLLVSALRFSSVPVNGYVTLRWVANIAASMLRFGKR